MDLSALEHGQPYRSLVQRDSALQERINSLRSDLLDERAERIARQQQANVAVLVAIGLAIGIGGLWASAKLRANADKAQLGTVTTRDQASVIGISATSAKALSGPAGQDHQEISVFVPEESDSDPGTLLRAAGSVSTSLVAVPLEDAVRRAISTSSGAEAVLPDQRWQVLALIAARRDTDLATRPWLSSGYLPRSAPACNGLPHSGTAMRSDASAGPNGMCEADPEEDRLRYEEVVADCAEAIRSRPGEVRLYLERADALSELGRHEEAVSDFDRAIALDPGNTAAYLGRCHARADLGRHDDAIDDFEEALRLDSDLSAKL